MAGVAWSDTAAGALFRRAHAAPTFADGDVVHFLAMCGILGFVPGHLIMVGLHGWDNFVSIFTGWKRSPEYVPVEREP